MMGYDWLFLVEFYKMMKRFGKRRVGKLINTLIALAVFLWSLFLLGQNMIIFFIPFFLLSIFILVKTVIFV